MIKEFVADLFFMTGLTVSLMFLCYLVQLFLATIIR